VSAPDHAPSRPSDRELVDVVERVLSDHRQGPGSVTSLQVFDEKAGQRCVAVAHLATAIVDPRSADPISTVYVKWFAAPARGERTYRTLDLVQRALAERTDVRTPVVLGMSAEPCVVVASAVTGTPVAHLSPASLAAAAPAVGRAVADLHRCGAEVPVTYRLDDELATVDEWAGHLAAHGASDAATARFRRLAEAVAIASTTFEHRTDAIVHRDLQGEHLYVASSEMAAPIGIIDLDEIRRGDPHVDLGHLAVHLQLDASPHVVSHLGAHPATGTPLFAGPFQVVAAAWSERSRMSIDPTRLAFFGALACLKLARQRAVGFGPHPRPAGAERWPAVERALQLGEQLTGVVGAARFA
jgi:aminoglycoside phosphotransferase (APT) family kinase protein